MRRAPVRCETETVAPPAAAPLSLYVHWPFCLAKCPYCDFNSHVAGDIDERRWCRALLAELAHYAAETKGRPLSTLFFGGGTPSLMAPETVAAVIDAAAGHWELAGDAEITLEANPTSAEAARFRDYRAAGINRLSLGVQALEDRALAFLGRGHTAQEALAAVSLAERTFPRVSFDLIYARPGQDVAAWRAELARALERAPGHLSLYQLTIEKGTPFYGRWRRGALVPPGEETAARLYEETRAATAAAGLAAYEISNHARPGEECRHNLFGWRGADYVGVGPGAHGRLSGAGGVFATEQLRAPAAWLAAVEAGGHGTGRRVRLAPEARIAEVVMSGLRLTSGIERADFEARFACALEAALDPARIARLAAAGFLECDARGLRATAGGRLCLDAVIRALLV